jgi:hypothetical protein
MVEGWEMNKATALIITVISTETQRGITFTGIKQSTLLGIFTDKEKLLEVRQDANSYWIGAPEEFYFTEIETEINQLVPRALYF